MALFLIRAPQQGFIKSNRLHNFAPFCAENATKRVLFYRKFILKAATTKSPHKIVTQSPRWNQLLVAVRGYRLRRWV